MKPNWNAIALNLPTLIGVGMSVIEAVKSKMDGKDKEAAVISGVKASLPPLEGIIGDQVNDAALDQLLSSYIQARVALLNFMTKQTTAPALPPA